MAAAKKAPAKKAPAKKTATPAVKSPAVKKSATKAPAKKTPAAKKAAPVAKKPAVKVAAKKATPAAKKAAPKVPAKKVAPAAKKAAPKAPAKKGAPVAKKPAEKKAAPVKVVPVKKVAEKKPAEKVVPVKPEPAPQVINPIGGVIPSVRKAVPGKKSAPKHPTIVEDESNWLKSELTTVRKILEKDALDLAAEIAELDENLHSIIMDSGEGAGDDQADAGTKTFEREHEISIRSNKEILLDQTNRALDRIQAGTYGACENCGKPIGKHRLLEANPRATLCMPCREKEDRS